MNFLSKTFISFIVLVLVGGYCFSSNLALAQEPKVETVEDVVRILNRAVDWMFTFLLIIAVIFIMLAAYNYLTASGNEDKVKKAHLMITYAVVAIAIGLLARSLEFIVRQFIQS